MKILVVEDNKTAMKVLIRALRNSDYDVVTAADGLLAWEILENEHIQMVISDWVMPGLNGPDLCKRIRSAEFSHYIFIILLTTKDRKSDIIEGINAGADDFMVKRFNHKELKARILAGERILKYEAILAERNKKLENAYSIIEKDLKVASKIQLGLLPQQNSRIYDIQFKWLFLPSAYVGGDIFNYFKLDEYHVGFYILDVAGHGVPAAMLSVTLSRVLTLKNNDACILKKKTDTPPFYLITKPSDVISNLNKRFQTFDETMQYFTMIYGTIDIRDGGVTISSAGHPPAFVFRKGGACESINMSGFPVGMFPDVEYEEEQFQLKKGEKFVIYSDGITECQNGKGEQFTPERFLDTLTSELLLPAPQLTLKLEKSIREWNDNDKFEDDITFLSIERENDGKLCLL